MQTLFDYAQALLLIAGLGCLLIAANTYWRKPGQFGNCRACKWAFPLLGASFGVAALSAMTGGDHGSVAGNLLIAVCCVVAGGRVAEKAAAR